MAAFIKAAVSAIGGGLGDQWLEAIKPIYTDDQTVMTKGGRVRQDSRDHNRKGTDDIISNGTIVHVPMNHFAMLVDGGKIVDFTDEEGYFTVSNSSSPSFLNGEVKGAIVEAARRFKFAGTTPLEQKVFYINTQEIKGIKFGTRNPVVYHDEHYDLDLFLRAHGAYSVKIVNPVLFYREAISKSSEHVTIHDINEQYLDEFLGAFTSALNQFSVEGVRAQHIVSKTQELNTFMEEALDDDWREKRGMEIESVGIASISLDEGSQKILAERSKGAALKDPLIREGYVQGSMARGVEAAGSNEAGAMQGFMGVGLGMNATGNMAGSMSQANMEQIRMQQEAQAQQQTAMQQEAAARQEAEKWTCSNCNFENASGNFCAECGQKKTVTEWDCPKCQRHNVSGKFCAECGTPKPEPKEPLVCGKCGYTVEDGSQPKFCPDCGTPFENSEEKTEE